VARRERDRPSAPSRYSPLRRSRLVLVLAMTVAAVTGTAGTASAVATEPDAAFLRAAQQSNLAIIAAARDAQVNGRASCVRRLGSVLERDHRKLNAQALPVARQLRVTLPRELSAVQRQELAAVRAKAGTTGYDAAWLTAQDREHRRALTLIDRELTGGTRPAVQSAASAARPVIQMHRDMIGGGTCRPGARTLSVATGDGGQMADALLLRRLGGLGLVGLGLLLLAGRGVAVLRRRPSVLRTERHARRP
jgi:predicted outer membrane protein